LRQSVGPGEILPQKDYFGGFGGYAETTNQICLHTARHTGVGIRSPFDTL